MDKQRGFTITELIIVITMVGILLPALFVFFDGAMNSYVKMQDDGLAVSDASEADSRIAKTVRGALGVIDAQAYELKLYVYYSATSTNVSVVRYYLSNDSKKILADIQDCPADPPLCVIPPSQTPKTITIMDGYDKNGGPALFKYFDSTNAELSYGSISDLNAINGIEINVTSKADGRIAATTTVTTMVNLRNRKTNL